MQGCLRYEKAWLKEHRDFSFPGMFSIAQLQHHTDTVHLCGCTCCTPLLGSEHIEPGLPLPVLLQRGQRVAALSSLRACVCNWKCISAGVTQRLESCSEAEDIHDILKNAQILQGSDFEKKHQRKVVQK